MAEITKDTTYYLESLVTDPQGDGVTGLTVTYKVIKSSDNSLKASGTLADVGEGVYQGSYLFDTVGQYRILYFTPTSYLDAIETVTVTTSSNVAISEKIDRILGLSQENYRLYDTKWDQAQEMTYGKIRIYPTAQDVEDDTNPIATYEIRAIYGQGKHRHQVVDYTVRRIA